MVGKLGPERRGFEFLLARSHQLCDLRTATSLSGPHFQSDPEAICVLLGGFRGVEPLCPPQGAPEYPTGRAVLAPRALTEAGLR